MVARNQVNTAALARVNAKLRRIRDQTREMGDFSVTVGVHEEEGSAQTDSGASLAAVAAFHEFGTSRVPRRSWLLDWLSENEGRVEEAFRRLAREVAARRMDAETAYFQLGEFAVSGIQARIRSNIPPPLSPVTVAAKGSSVALIDEGRLIASIRHRVRRGGT
jgi:sugar phosphate isomerase/epimerase